ncbi:fructose-specific PTS transporter subunit EIIC [Mycolicibacterium sp.]|uniref:fructose-specific PTS transporter subunit EIIC n=1 Tax=Mycolicibacterium sp. TaxID=2320850 RepID=UPI0028AA6563|nr:fructose-specific PTS transporter subunit EIIC [Mycolicibacterium sp.]
MRYVAITACPTGIAHTYMAAEKLQMAASESGHELKVETQGSIGAENVLTAADIAAADAVIIAADKNVDLDRFAGKRVLTVGVADGIHKPAELLMRAINAPVQAGTAAVATEENISLGQTLYRALMAGVSPMIPFVVVGGLLIAVSLSLGGTPDPSGGLVVPEGTFWWKMLQIGTIGFQMMIPILAGFIAMSIADRPGLVPGMITGIVANTGTIYGSEAGSGFLGAILAGFLAGYVTLAIKRVKVPKFMAGIMPIIVIPMFATVVSSLAFIYVLGKPIAGLFSALTNWLSGLSGANAVVLGIILGVMIAFDMGGPVNKVAFLFGVGLIATGQTAPMGMIGAAIAAPPIGQGLATVLRRKLYDDSEQEMGLAAMFMGLFGITEGAIPFAAADPARVIPANMVGGAVAGATAALFGVTNAVPHGGGIVAVLGAVHGIPGYLIAIALGSIVTALMTLGLKMRHQANQRGAARVPAAASLEQSEHAVGSGFGAAQAATAVATAPAKVGLAQYITAETVAVDLTATDRDAAIAELVGIAARTGRVNNPAAVVASALDREAFVSTGLGDGIAIPHAKTDAVSEPVVVYARSRAGIDWSSRDGKPATELFLIAVPEQAAGDAHLTILGSLSRKLVNPQFRSELSAAGPDQAYELLATVE